MHCVLTYYTVIVNFLNWYRERTLQHNCNHWIHFQASLLLIHSLCWSAVEFLFPSAHIWSVWILLQFAVRFIIIDLHTFTFDWASNALVCMCFFISVFVFHYPHQINIYSIFTESTFNIQHGNFESKKNLLRHWHWDTHFSLYDYFPCCNNDDSIKNRMHSGCSVLYQSLHLFLFISHFIAIKYNSSFQSCSISIIHLFLWPAFGLEVKNKTPKLKLKKQIVTIRWKK